MTTGIRRQLGMIMVEEGFLTQEQLDAAIIEQHKTSKPLGQVLIELELVSAGVVANALAEQAGMPVKTEYGLSVGFHAPENLPPPPALTPILPQLQGVATPEEMARRRLVGELDALREHCAALARGIALLESELERLREAV